MENLIIILPCNDDFAMILHVHLGKEGSIFDIQGYRGGYRGVSLGVSLGSIYLTLLPGSIHEKIVSGQNTNCGLIPLNVFKFTKCLRSNASVTVAASQAILECDQLKDKCTVCKYIITNIYI